MKLRPLNINYKSTLVFFRLNLIDEIENIQSDIQPPAETINIPENIAHTRETRAQTKDNTKKHYIKHLDKTTLLNPNP